jgi:hypothetical protein
MPTIHVRPQAAVDGEHIFIHIHSSSTTTVASAAALALASMLLQLLQLLRKRHTLQPQRVILRTHLCLKV